MKEKSLLRKGHIRLKPLYPHTPGKPIEEVKKEIFAYVEHQEKEYKEQL